ncbi:hypothetical protein CLU79DRAFT_752296 [Phycomyces nitens]|nr:hypothetical protein CLU79DRAFT_752296 [Phycomyces nitens]
MYFTLVFGGFADLFLISFYGNIVGFKGRISQRRSFCRFTYLVSCYSPPTRILHICQWFWLN